MTAIKRLEFSKACTARELSGETVLAYTEQMRGKPDSEKERLAEQFTKEIERKYPLKKDTRNPSAR